MNLPNVRQRNIQFRTGRVHRIFFGLRRARCRWSKAGAKVLLAVKCCIENNREATSSIGGFAAPPSDQKNWNADAVLPLLRSDPVLLGEGAADIIAGLFTRASVFDVSRICARWPRRRSALACPESQGGISALRHVDFASSI